MFERDNDGGGGKPLRQRVRPFDERDRVVTNYLKSEPQFFIVDRTESVCVKVGHRHGPLIPLCKRECGAGDVLDDSERPCRPPHERGFPRAERTVKQHETGRHDDRCERCSDLLRLGRGRCDDVDQNRPSCSVVPSPVAEGAGAATAGGSTDIAGVSGVGGGAPMSPGIRAKSASSTWSIFGV